MYLGIDIGGTNTDAVLVSQGRVLAAAKSPTCAEHLAQSTATALQALFAAAGNAACGSKIVRVGLGSTLAVNAMIHNTYETPGLAISAGPGLDPTWAKPDADRDNYFFVVPGGLDHQGLELNPLDQAHMRTLLGEWQAMGIRCAAVVGKFSPRNKNHEQSMAAILGQGMDYLCQGHLCSGALGFSRRVATAYWNAALWRIHKQFTAAVSASLAALGIHAPLYLLQADGGALPMNENALAPVQGAFSGPAASVMGCLAVRESCSPAMSSGDTLLVDIGGTTADIALMSQGQPLMDAAGLRLKGRPTLVRALYSLSVGIGGDSALAWHGNTLCVGPQRLGPACAFGGQVPTLVDALNAGCAAGIGNTQASVAACAHMAAPHNMDVVAFGRMAVDTALETLAQALRLFVETSNERPLYTLEAILHTQRIAPSQVVFIGAPAAALAPFAAKALGLPVVVPPHSGMINAIGAALARPTALVDMFADTRTRKVWAPAYAYERSLDTAGSLVEIETESIRLLEQHARLQGYAGHARALVTESQLFSTLDASGRSSRDIRVRSQLLPGLVEYIKANAD